MGVLVAAATFALGVTLAWSFGKVFHVQERLIVCARCKAGDHDNCRIPFACDCECARLNRMHWR